MADKLDEVNASYDRISDADIESEVADWVLDNCDPITKQKFLDWVYSD